MPDLSCFGVSCILVVDGFSRGIILGTLVCVGWEWQQKPLFGKEVYKSAGAHEM
jgi:hypothetical protein